MLSMLLKELIYHLFLYFFREAHGIRFSGDTGLLDLLKHDNQMTLNIEQKWMEMANSFPAR